MNPLPPSLEAERQALLREIDEAFGGVILGNGISWNDADIIDRYGYPRQDGPKLREDVEAGWQALVDHPDWSPMVLWGHLDGKGFRYYLPAVLVRSIRSGHDEGICFWLTIPEWDADEFINSWSLFDKAQCGCVGRFLRFMASVAVSRDDGVEFDHWMDALRSGWP